jgi:hypothetical protein
MKNNSEAKIPLMVGGISGGIFHHHEIFENPLQPKGFLKHPKSP